MFQAKLDTPVGVTPEDHQKIHQDERQVGPIGGLAGQGIRKALRGEREKQTFIRPKGAMTEEQPESPHIATSTAVGCIGWG